MSCDVALAATLFFASASPAPAIAPHLIYADAPAAPSSVATEPMFADIVARARKLKAEADAMRGSGLAKSTAPVMPSGFAVFQTDIGQLSALDMQGHLELAKRGTDGDLKCILKGISQDLPLKLQAVAGAKTGAEEDMALRDMAYLLNDNIEVITAPPIPKV
jgi:hypothetical protein